MIRQIEEKDRDVYLELTREFYTSSAVDHEIDEQNRIDTFNHLMTDTPYAECIIVECDGECAGYALFAKTFSQEAGGLTVWLEEVYIRESFRSRGLGNEIFDWTEKRFPDARRLRLEVEEDNVRAIELYKRRGFVPLPYMQMIKDRQ